MATPKKWTNRTLRVYSRHPSHTPIRKNVLVPVLACLRLGSTTEWNKSEYEINSIEGVKNSSSKLKMKQCFNEGDVRTADWWKTPMEVSNLDEVPYPIIAKKIFGSRGEGMVKLDTQEAFEEFVTTTQNISSYIFEKFYNYVREYRLHIDANGCFYACRKMLKSDTEESQRWFRNDSNCVWYLPDNEAFDKPTNWEEIEHECVKALNSVGLDVGACDVRVQSSSKDNPEFIIVEINSAPSFGDVTLERYQERLPTILTNKYNL